MSLKYEQEYSAYVDSNHNVAYNGHTHPFKQQKQKKCKDINAREKTLTEHQKRYIATSCRNAKSKTKSDYNLMHLIDEVSYKVMQDTHIDFIPAVAGCIKLFEANRWQIPSGFFENCPEGRVRNEHHKKTLEEHEAHKQADINANIDYLNMTNIKTISPNKTKIALDYLQASASIAAKYNEDGKYGSIKMPEHVKQYCIRLENQIRECVNQGADLAEINRLKAKLNYRRISNQK